MSGRGAWPFFYKLGLDFRNNPQGRDAHGIYALKKELIHNGYSQGIVATLAYWGASVDARCREFQRDHGLVVDGQLGPKTALALFHKRALEQETQFGIPNNLLCHLKSEESSNDPVAQGFVDTDDEGLVQINVHFHPEISQEQAWDPSFCLPWGAKYLKDAYVFVGNDWDGAVAAYNVGREAARLWVNAGKPAQGGPSWFPDAYSRATHYVALVKASGC